MLMVIHKKMLLQLSHFELKLNKPNANYLQWLRKLMISNLKMMHAERMNTASSLKPTKTLLKAQNLKPQLTA